MQQHRERETLLIPCNLVCPHSEHPEVEGPMWHPAVWLWRTGPPRSGEGTSGLQRGRLSIRIFYMIQMIYSTRLEVSSERGTYPPLQRTLPVAHCWDPPPQRYTRWVGSRSVCVYSNLQGGNPQQHYNRTVKIKERGKKKKKFLQRAHTVTVTPVARQHHKRNKKDELMKRWRLLWGRGEDLPVIRKKENTAK